MLIGNQSPLAIIDGQYNLSTQKKNLNIIKRTKLKKVVTKAIEFAENPQLAEAYTNLNNICNPGHWLGKKIKKKDQDLSFAQYERLVNDAIITRQKLSPPFNGFFSKEAQGCVLLPSVKSCSKSALCAKLAKKFYLIPGQILVDTEGKHGIVMGMTEEHGLRLLYKDEKSDSTSFFLQIYKEVEDCKSWKDVNKLGFKVLVNPKDLEAYKNDNTIDNPFQQGSNSEKNLQAQNLSRQDNTLNTIAAEAKNGPQLLELKNKRAQSDSFLTINAPIPPYISSKLPSEIPMNTPIPLLDQMILRLQPSVDRLVLDGNKMQNIRHIYVTAENFIDLVRLADRAMSNQLGYFLLKECNYRLFRMIDPLNVIDIYYENSGKAFSFSKIIAERYVLNQRDKIENRLLNLPYNFCTEEFVNAASSFITEFEFSEEIRFQLVKNYTYMIQKEPSSNEGLAIPKFSKENSTGDFQQNSTQIRACGLNDDLTDWDSDSTLLSYDTDERWLLESFSQDEFDRNDSKKETDLLESEKEDASPTLAKKLKTTAVRP
ncbi:MAG: hypothetical protein K0S74_356 [Chlamydiales bacterium]|jgi:hypothetical protein|nr:hypothetical protein [Chlamydiales bacterium]